MFQEEALLSNFCVAQYEDKQDIEDIQYITFLLMARAGLKALEYYDPKTKKHGQAHMQARCVSSIWLYAIILTEVQSRYHAASHQVRHRAAGGDPGC